LISRQGLAALLAPPDLFPAQVRHVPLELPLQIGERRAHRDGEVASWSTLTRTALGKARRSFTR